MSKYTTGEIAKLCGVTVRTVQYYDSRNILVPSELSEGGRRLYSQEDVKRLRIICFLRDAGLSIDGICHLLKDKHPEAVIQVLLQEQEAELRKELSKLEQQLQKVETLEKELKSIRHFTVESIGDVAHIMEGTKKRKRMLWGMLLVGMCIDIIEVAMIVYGIRTGIWWPVLPGLLVIVLLVAGAIAYYCQHTAYICPLCHNVFRASFWEAFWARHTPRLRRVTCSSCGEKSFCVEIYREVDKENEHA